MKLKLYALSLSLFFRIGFGEEKTDLKTMVRCIVGFMWLPSYLFKPFHNKTRRDIEDCKYLQSPYFSLNPKIILLRTENGSTMPQIFFGRKLITNSIIWVDEIP